MPILHREQTVPLPLDRVFEFFSDPHNLLRITPPQLNLVVTNREPVEMRSGAEITYTIRWLRIPMRWRTLISAYDPPHSFVDEQIRGPYRRWHHTHTFHAEGGSTRIVDRVAYELPFGPLGTLAHTLLVRRQLEGIFDYRREAIAALFAG
jgi:ligand-binding SRPBCC domain-containing protein